MNNVTRRQGLRMVCSALEGSAGWDLRLAITLTLPMLFRATRTMMSHAIDL